MPDLAIRLLGASWHNSNLSMSEKLMWVGQAAERYGTDCPAGPDGNRALHVVVAPEYTFRRSPLAVLSTAALDDWVRRNPQADGSRTASRVVPLGARLPG